MCLEESETLMRPIPSALAISLVLLLIAVWWFALDSRAPASSHGEIPLQEMRRAIAADDRETLASKVDLYRVGSGEAPMYAVEAGGGFGKFRMAYSAFALKYHGRHIVIDAAADRATAMTIGDRKAARFSDTIYSSLEAAMRSAALILLTHEHKDHIMAVVRNPNLADFAHALMFPEAQRNGLLRFASKGANSSTIAAQVARPIDGVTRMAPGLAVAPAPGHSPGSQVILARLANGREYLFIGDIAWSYDDIVRLRTRPRFLQWLMFDPNEDRQRVLRQLRELHDLQAANPALVIVPSHDDAYFDRLLDEGKLSSAVPLT